MFKNIKRLNLIIIAVTLMSANLFSSDNQMITKQEGTGGSGPYITYIGKLYCCTKLINRNLFLCSGLDLDGKGDIILDDEVAERIFRRLEELYIYQEGQK